MKKVLIIIITYNGMRWMERCLSSATASPDFADVYVLDNNSSDGTADYVQRNFPSVILVRSKENLGFAKGNNEGFKYALENGYDSVYLLNQDAWITPETLPKLYSLAKSNPSFGILSPLQMQADGEHFNKAFGRDVMPAAKPVPDVKDILRIPFVMAAHWMITRTCLEKVGLFASILPHFGNDDNYCHRVIYHGFSIGIVPSLKVIHDHQEKEKTVQQLVYQNYTMTVLVRLSDIRRPFLFGLIWMIPYTMVKSLRYRSLLPIKSIPQIIHQLPEVRRTRRLTRREGVREV